MSLRAFPGPGAWACLIALVAIDAVAIAALGFRLAWPSALAILAVSAAACSVGYFYTAIRPDRRIACLAFAAGYLIAFTFAAALLSYVGTSFNLPLLDARFAEADAALGLDWLATLAFADAHPVVGATLRLAYHSSMLQMVAVILILAATDQHKRLGDFLALFAATGLITIVLSILFPAAGAFVFHDPPHAMRDVVGNAAGVWHLEHFHALRSGAMRTIDPAAIEGLITFPSFHTALAVITAWAFWRTRYLAWPTVVLSAIVIASTVPVGGHYFVDVFAGAAIATACIAVVQRPVQRVAGTALLGAIRGLLATGRRVPAG